MKKNNLENHCKPTLFEWLVPLIGLAKYNIRTAKIEEQNQNRSLMTDEEMIIDYFSKSRSPFLQFGPSSYPHGFAFGFVHALESIACYFLPIVFQKEIFNFLNQASNYLHLDQINDYLNSIGGIIN